MTESILAVRYFIVRIPQLPVGNQFGLEDARLGSEALRSGLDDGNWNSDEGKS